MKEQPLQQQSVPPPTQETPPPQEERGTAPKPIARSANPARTFTPKKEVRKARKIEGEKPRFAYSEELIEQKIELPDLNQANMVSEPEQEKTAEVHVDKVLAITEEGVYAAWKSFAEELEKAGMNTVSLFTDRKIVVDIESNKLHINFENALQLDQFSDLKTDLLVHLRTTLSNPHVQVDVTVAEVKNDTNRLYTDRDKLNFLMEKNDLIRQMKDRFGLDVEY